MVFGRLLNKCVASLSSCKTKKLEEAFLGKGEAYSLFDKLKEIGISPNVTSYSSLIDKATKRNLSFLSVDLFKDMLQQGIRPDIRCYNSMRHVLHNTRGIFDTEKGIVRDILAKSGLHEQNAITYNATVILCCRARKYQQAHNNFIEMRSKGFSLDGFTCFTIISSFIKTRDMWEAPNFLKEPMMISDEIEHDHLVSYDTILDVYFKKHGYSSEYLDEVDSFFDKHSVKGILNAMIKFGHIKKALECLEFMRSCEECQSYISVVFNCVIDGLCKHGRIDEAMQLFESMEKKDSITLTTLLNNLCKATRFLSAFQLMLAYSRDNMKIPESTKRAVLDGIHNSGHGKPDMES